MCLHQIEKGNLSGIGNEALSYSVETLMRKKAPILQDGKMSINLNFYAFIMGNSHRLSTILDLNSGNKSKYEISSDYIMNKTSRGENRRRI